LVVIDHYSKWSEMKIILDHIAATIVVFFKKRLSTYMVPLSMFSLTMEESGLLNLIIYARSMVFTINTQHHNHYYKNMVFTLLTSCLKWLYNQYQEYTSSLKWLNVFIMTKI
jgi:hypothetical protein